MHGGMDRLVKEIDALTYNSRSVLNALIRSTLVSSNSNGFKVERADVVIKLDKVDIYRLSKFYTEWESKQYTESEFDVIRTAHDSIPVTIPGSSVPNTSKTTEALVKHSKVLFLNTSNKSNNDNYWLDKVKNASNPKLISNSAPIPLNLRTPIFNENMSTAMYNSEETYLFPAQYYYNTVLGYKGDGDDHQSGGKSWQIEVDNNIRLNAIGVALNTINPQAKFKTENRRNYELNSNGEPLDVTNSFVWGYDTHARALNSSAGGSLSIVPKGADCAIAYGLANIASNATSLAIGGLLNTSAGRESSVIGGNSNFAIADNTVAMGWNNIAGSVINDWTFQQIIQSEVDDCIEKAIAECNGTTINNQNYNVIVINGNVTNNYKTSDTIRLFNFKTSNDNTLNEYHNVNGDAYLTLDTLISSISYDVSMDKTIITLSNSVPNAINIGGGKLSRIKSGSYEYGWQSVAIGHGLISDGYRQITLGAYNLSTANVINGKISHFVIGTGWEGERFNSVEVFNDRTTIIYGKGKLTDVYNANGELKIAGAQSAFTGLIVDKNSISKYALNTLMQLSDNSFNILKGNSVANNYISIRSAINSNDLEITNSAQGNIYLLTGTDVSIPENIGFGSNVISSNNYTYIRSNYISISTNNGNASLITDINNDMSINFNKLILNGNTLGALPTNAKQETHYLPTLHFDNVGIKNRSGFFYTDTGSDTYGLSHIIGNFYSGSGSGADKGLQLVVRGNQLNESGKTNYIAIRQTTGNAWTPLRRIAFYDELVFPKTDNNVSATYTLNNENHDVFLYKFDNSVVNLDGTYSIGGTYHISNGLATYNCTLSVVDGVFNQCYVDVNNVLIGIIIVSFPLGGMPKMAIGYSNKYAVSYSELSNTQYVLQNNLYTVEVGNIHNGDYYENNVYFTITPNSAVIRDVKLIKFSITAPIEE